MTSRDINAPATVGGSTRYEWMDIARGFAILLVMIVHGGAIYGRLGYDVPAWVKTAGLAMAPYRMPLLIFLSGFLLNKSMQKGLFLYLYGKFRNIFWPFVIWTIVYCLANERIADVLNYPVWTGNSYLWYMAFLLVYFAIAIFVIRIPLAIVATYAFAIAIASPDGSTYGERMFVLMGYFFLGAYCGIYLNRFVDIISDKRVLLLAPLCVATSVYSATYQSINFSPAFAVIILPSIIAICAILFQAQQFAFTRFLKFVGRNSIVYYVIHVPLYMVIVKLFAAAGYVEAYVVIPVCIASGIALATVLGIGNERRGVIRLLFSAPDILKAGERAAPLRRFVDNIGLLPKDSTAKSGTA